MSSPTQSPTQPPPPPDQDPFDNLLTLEDTLYTSAYNLGVRDGEHAGRIEGRIFGLEKGFEKFAAMGKLHGRACVWGSRLPKASTPKESSPHRGEKGKASSAKGPQSMQQPTTEKKTPVPLPPLPKTHRLEKHVPILHALTDPLTFSTLNTEDAVADFEDRFKRSSAKAKIIERIVGEDSGTIDIADEEGVGKNENEKEVKSREIMKSPKRPRKGRIGNVTLSGEGKKRGDDSMEDFAGSPFLKR